MKKLIIISILFITGCSLDFKNIEKPDELITLSELKKIKADTVLYKVSVNGITVRLFSKDNVFVKESQPNKFPLLTVHALFFLPLIAFAFIGLVLLLKSFLE